MLNMKWSTAMVACFVFKLAVSSFTALPVVSKCNWTHKIGDAPFVVRKVTLTLYAWGAIGHIMGHNTINVSSAFCCLFFQFCKRELNNDYAPATHQRYVKLFSIKYQRQSLLMLEIIQIYSSVTTSNAIFRNSHSSSHASTVQHMTVFTTIRAYCGVDWNKAKISN